MYLSQIRLGGCSLSAETRIPQEGGRVDHVAPLLDLGREIKQLGELRVCFRNEILNLLAGSIK
jgi:hypothetical protein